MNFSLSEFSLGRQRCRQWAPLITQQLRLRHVYQILAYNLRCDRKGSFYFTLHVTSMSSPFYSSDKVNGKHPKWSEVALTDSNGSSSAVVIRIWQTCKTGDRVVLTWGVNFSGLVYLGNKIADLHPRHFKENTVIFFMQGGYFTSHQYLTSDVSKPVPFAKNLNLIDNKRAKLLYRRIAIKTNPGEVQPSYGLEKLRKLQDLQLKIRKEMDDVQNVKDKIKRATMSSRNTSPEPVSDSGNVRFAPQLLTMNSLNKMLHEKPTQRQREEMTRISKEIEVVRFKIRMLSQERDKKYAYLRKLRAKEEKLSEENEEQSSDLMARYHMLNRDNEKLKEYKRSMLHHLEMYEHISSQLHHRQSQLLKMLLFIYPIEKGPDDKYTIHKVHLPNSDVLAECSDTGLSVALGFVTHCLVMCSIFLQVPLRYPMVHMGSRSVIVDQTSPIGSDKDREFPLFTKGKEKVHFSYGVYLLNKNLAQLRWLMYLNTPNLGATLPNLLHFLQSGRDSRPNSLVLGSLENVTTIGETATVSLSSIGTWTTSSLNDPILDSIKKDTTVSKYATFHKRAKPCGKGLGEILAIPEAYLNRQINKDAFESFVTSRNFGYNGKYDDSIKIKEGTEETNKTTNESIDEQGTDTLDPSYDFSSSVSKSIDIHSNRQLKQNRRLSRSVGSYTDDDRRFKGSFELGSDPATGGVKSLEQWPQQQPGSSDGLSSPLTARTDKLLLSMTSFNLVKTKPTN